MGSVGPSARSLLPNTSRREECPRSAAVTISTTSRDEGDGAGRPYEAVTAKGGAFAEGSTHLGGCCQTARVAKIGDERPGDRHHNLAKRKERRRPLPPGHHDRGWSLLCKRQHPPSALSKGDRVDLPSNSVETTKSEMPRP